MLRLVTVDYFANGCSVIENGILELDGILYYNQIISIWRAYSTYELFPNYGYADPPPLVLLPFL